ncbi:hypothetical protein VTK73DRAFT_9131 [Phialemonium thermophilum]|uniref:Uncharacterized protein n=1 Tax=Phialemonium thermophilum TaxID=223376 RepID=A0ABR3W4E2_9PEZI
MRPLCLTFSPQLVSKVQYTHRSPPTSVIGRHAPASLRLSAVVFPVRSAPPCMHCIQDGSSKVGRLEPSGNQGPGCACPTGRWQARCPVRGPLPPPQPQISRTVQRGGQLPSDGRRAPHFGRLWGRCGRVHRMGQQEGRRGRHETDSADSVLRDHLLYHAGLRGPLPNVGRLHRRPHGACLHCELGSARPACSGFFPS